MKTTLDLPDSLMRQVKIRAASEGLKLKDLVADFLQQGLARSQPATLPEGELPYHRDPNSGFLVSRRLGTPGLKKVSLAESLAATEQANEEEALSRAGISR